MAFYRAIAHRLIAGSSHPVIFVDWTAVTPTLWALVAAVPFDGRALTVYAETHPISRYLKPRTNRRFLRRLNEVLPDGCTPIIVTDAGFRSPWMKLVANRGWDYICRVRHARVRIRKGDGWLTLTQLWQRCRTVPDDFGELELGARVRHRCRFIGIRKRRAILKHTSARSMSDGDKARRSAKQPWILATSLAETSPAAVVATYRRRMQIEETFRDAKSSRFGLSLSQARTRSEDRANVLLLLATLTHLFAVFIGLAAEALGLQRHYQANTVRTKRVLSLASLGRLIAADRKCRIPRSALLDARRLMFELRASVGVLT